MKFYGHFAAAYGTTFLALLGLAVLTQSHIDAGAFGMFGFPVIAFIYAFIRLAGDQSPGEIQRLKRRVAALEQELGRDPGHEPRDAL